MKATGMSMVESKFRPLIGFMPECLVVSAYSKGRKFFLRKLAEEEPTQFYVPPKGLMRNLWGLEFPLPLMNAAGMFKNGECYEMVARQGAGAYLGGTGTWNKRPGNVRGGVHLPFVPYPLSHAASNALGLPNAGDEENAQRVQSIASRASIPIGWSIMASPDFKGEERLEKLVRSANLYESAGVDFLEWNRSCPNTGHGKPGPYDLAIEKAELTYFRNNFMIRCERPLPIVVKYSNDTSHTQVPAIMDMLFELGYQGVNFGNTSIDYKRIGGWIDSREKNLFDYFINHFEGGVSGKPLKMRSLLLAAQAVDYMRAGRPSQEFHVIRTGGIESWKDIEESDQAGVSMNQWFTGYFEQFARHGHDLYRRMLE